MRLSVIIPARNAASDLEHLLLALVPQLTSDDDCIVVDDASSDTTGQIAERYKTRVERLDVQKGAAVARNTGTRSTAAEILVFLDADVVPHADVLERFRYHFRKDPELAAVLGAYDDAPFSNATVSRFRNLLHCYTHRTGNRDAFTFWTGCGAMRRGAFEEAGGFDVSFAGIEDVELGVRVRASGKRILLDPSIEVQHRKIWTLGSFVRTDIWLRAVPWSTLLLTSRKIPSDLNLKFSQRVSVAATSLAAVFLPFAALRPLTGGVPVLVLLAIVVGTNLALYRFLARCGGVFFAIQSIPLHLVYYLCGAIGFVIAAIRLAIGPRHKDQYSEASRIQRK